MKVFLPKFLSASLVVIICALQTPSQTLIQQDNLNTLLDFLRKVPAKSEFEKTLDYDKRTAQFLKQTVYDGRPGDSSWTAIDDLGVFAIKTSYDADNELMTFPFAASYWHLLQKGWQCSVAIENNPAAEQMGLIFINYDDFFINTPNLKIKNYVGYAALKVSNEDAPSLKANARVAYFFRPSKPFTGDCFSRPSIAATLVAIQIFDSRTGKVFYDTRPKGSVPVQTHSKPIIVNSGVLNGKATSLVMPVWPVGARAVRLASSQVVVEVQLSEEGKVMSAKAISGPSLLFEAAVAAALKSRFSTTLLSGQPVKVKGSIRYNYVP